MAEQTKPDCKFCADADMMILPLRYAVVCSSHDIKLKPLSGTLGGNVNKTVLSPASSNHKQAAYSVRPLRPGYLYVLLDRGGVKSWQAYAVTQGAELYKFMEKMPPSEPPVFSCTTEGHRINASMIHIQNPCKVEKAWMLFTPNPLTPAKLDEIKKAPDSCAAMQTFSPAGWLKGNNGQPHSLQAKQLPEQVAEMQVGCPYTLNAVYESLFPPYENADIFSEKKDIRDCYPFCRRTKNKEMKKAVEKNLAHLEDLKSRLERNADQKANRPADPAFVLHDAIGITQELNVWRNQGLRRWYEQNNEGGVTNDHGKSGGDFDHFATIIDLRFNSAANDYVSGRAQDHLAWLKSQQLIDALSVYDEEHPCSGIAFQSQMVLAMVGMLYSKPGQEVHDQWFVDAKKGSEVKKSNLAVRAYCYNQKDILEKIGKLLQRARDGEEAEKIEEANWYVNLSDPVEKEKYLAELPLVKDFREVFATVTETAHENKPKTLPWRNLWKAQYACVKHSPSAEPLNGKEYWA